MLKKILLILLLLYLSTSAPNPVNAQLPSTPVAISWDEQFNSTELQEVNTATQGLPLKFSITGILPQNHKCRPDEKSISSQSVELIDEVGKSHPIHTVSSSDSSVAGYYKFSLSNLLPFYELASNKVHTLTFKGGVSNDGSTVRFECINSSGATQYYFLPGGDHALTFTTGDDTIAPTILESSAMTALNRAVVYWKASEPVSKTVRYGTSSGNLSSTVQAQQYDYWYVTTINNLLPGTTYYYEIEAKDGGGNRPAANPIRSLATWSLSPISISDITGHEATIAWTSSVPTDSIVEYGETQDLGRRSGSNELRNDHNIRLVNLTSNTTYFARITVSNDKTTSTSHLFQFKTMDASAGVVAPPITVTPGFTDRFDLSDFNFKDFPPDDLLASPSAQASDGAVLASTDNGFWQNLPNQFNGAMAANPWLVWLWVPILLLLALIVLVWLLHRHDKRMAKITVNIPPKL